MNGYSNHEDFGVPSDYDVPVRHTVNGRIGKLIQVTPVQMVRVRIGRSEHLLTTDEAETLQDGLRSMWEEPVIASRRWNP